MRTPLHRRARVAACVAATALALVGVGQLVAFPDAEPTKPGAGPKPEDVSPAAEPGGATVPAAVSPRHGIACPRDWSFFDNPDLHYGICVPPGWGFSDLARAGRLDAIRTATLAGLRLLSPEAFPWEAGARPFDAIVRRGVREIELTLLEPGAVATTECEPDRRFEAGTFTFASCEQSYDPLGEPAATGVVRAIKVAVPLARAASGAGGQLIPGARLLVIARYATGTDAEEVKTLWSIVRTIRPW